MAIGLPTALYPLVPLKYHLMLSPQNPILLDFPEQEPEPPWMKQTKVPPPPLFLYRKENPTEYGFCFLGLSFQLNCFPLLAFLLQFLEESVKVLKQAAKTRKVAVEDVLSALSVIEKAKIEPSGFLDTLGGSKSPGRTWMLIFTAENQLKGGRYFPLTAVQRFDAAAKRIENGVYLGPIGSLTFEGKFTWKQRILAFIFECIRIKIGPLNPLEISLGQKEDREPSTKDPFFIWFYVDEEIAVARGRSGGTAFWLRCRRVAA
ncbi:hypothetical protein FH972_019704 [Carpinus fangiana]|uniref:Plastid lipid-associated protein/fibrillin conserved domain-containing protein n=1 Tax=Carpinus fangiana TaxID=176857 RepID=A0A5N6RSF7_9ROSI|nr:hypothetical protein FH972_019704 [Carpinus fangiana]